MWNITPEIFFFFLSNEIEHLLIGVSHDPYSEKFGRF